MVSPALDLDRLLKLRLAIGRLGEGDRAAWWNTRGQLGATGGKAVSRGFPRTHRFAQARSVFAVAAHRCTEVFEPPGCVTLWRLPTPHEEAFDARWEHWLDNAGEWTRSSRSSSHSPAPTHRHSPRPSSWSTTPTSRREQAALAEGRAVPLPGSSPRTDADVALLALGFARGEPRRSPSPTPGAS
jgi:hypothetical protein